MMKMAIEAPAAILLLSMVVGLGLSQTWSDWSDWSECSRTCDGGASYQLRKCRGASQCHGDSIRYKTCNRNPCPAGSGDFRAQQCAAYNDVLYEGRIYEWVPISEPRDPCSLRCRAAGHAFSVTLAPKVLDGTRCDDSSIDMCINGRCRKVGCDGVLGSDVMLDSCGVCGGDDSSCQHRGRHRQLSSVFHWVETEAGPCSVTCGVGVAQISVVCKDRRNDRVVYNTYCRDLPRPATRTRECRAQVCRLDWLKGEWQDCSKPCGGGTSRRHVYCVEELDGRGFIRTYSHLCTTKRPATERSCNNHPCPKWYAGSWSPCSVTCGKGVKHREVICRRTQRHGCQLSDRPDTRRTCHTYVHCMGQKASFEKDPTITNADYPIHKDADDGSAIQEGNLVTPSKEDRAILDFLNQLLEGNTTGSTPRAAKLSSGPQSSGTAAYNLNSMNPEPMSATSKTATTTITMSPLRHKHKIKILKEKPPVEGSHYIPEADIDDNMVIFGATRRNTSYLDPLLEGRLGMDGSGGGEDVLTPDGIFEPNIAAHTAPRDGVSTVPKFVASAWGPCSTTCGLGIRTRLVICKVYLRFSMTVQDLPDDSCEGEKPLEVEACTPRECPVIPTQISNHLHEWRTYGHGPCNATCLGGYKEQEYRCVKLPSEMEALSNLCDGITKPVGQKVVCNEIPCPPRWRIAPYRPCSALCAAGHKRRRVECIQELARGEDNVAVLPDNECPQPIPPRSILCNLIDCPPSWVVAGDWSSCSMTCGEGIQKRLVLCQQVVAPGKIQNVTDSSICPKEKPEDKRPCYSTTCPETPTEGHVHIETDSSKYILVHKKQRVTLVVGGEAVLLTGTKIVIRCPARHYNRKLVYWRKIDELIPKRGRVKVSRHGALHIKRSSVKDTGTYTCVVDANSANYTISFHTPLEAERVLQERINYINYNYKDIMKHHRTDENRINQVYPPNENEGFEARNRDHDHYQDYSVLISSIGNNVSSIPYIYVAGSWSACSQTCGFRGLQWRNVTCELIAGSFIKVVDGEHCKSRGLTPPLASRDCGMQSCPHWEIGPWSLCTGKDCSRNGVGTSRRGLYCVMENGTSVKHSACKATAKPDGSRECRFDACHATWKPSKWSKCSRSCGGLGMMRRTLSCVWRNNNKPAGRHCKGLSKPPTEMACSSPDCRHVACVDKSSTCSMIPRLRMCHIWHRECCWSCHASIRLQ